MKKIRETFAVTLIGISLALMTLVSAAGVVVLNRHMIRLVRELGRMRHALHAQANQIEFLRSEIAPAVSALRTAPSQTPEEPDDFDYVVASDVAELATKLVTLNVKLKEAGLEHLAVGTEEVITAPASWLPQVK